MRSVLGTPDEGSWPGVSSLPDYKTSFPKWRPQPLSKIVPQLDHVGLDLLSVRLLSIAYVALDCRRRVADRVYLSVRQRMLVYEPSRRISARAAMSHPWFDDLHQQYAAFRGASNQHH